MNTSAKGRRNEYRTKAYLEEQGWDVELCKHQKFGGNDFFGLWDAIAVRKGRVRWIQVKTNRLPPKAIREALRAFQGPGSKELWIWYDRKKEPRIICLTK